VPAAKSAALLLRDSGPRLNALQTQCFEHGENSHCQTILTYPFQMRFSLICASDRFEPSAHFRISDIGQGTSLPCVCAVLNQFRYGL